MSKEFIDSPEFRTVICELITMHLKKSISNAALRSMRIEVFQDWASSFGREFGLYISGEFPKKQYERIEETHSIEVPLTWWDHFKCRWFPQRWLKRWPAQMQKITTCVQHQEIRVCPHLEYPVPQHNYMHLKFLLREKTADTNSFLPPA